MATMSRRTPPVSIRRHRAFIKYSAIISSPLFSAANANETRAGGCLLSGRRCIFLTSAADDDRRAVVTGACIADDRRTSVFRAALEDQTWSVARRRCSEPRWRTRRGPWPDVGVPSRAGGPDVVRGRTSVFLAVLEDQTWSVAVN